MLERHDYLPFGEDAQPMTGDPMRFAGKELDSETGLQNFEARYYRQTWGRFTQVDPLHVGAALTDPQQWNRYAYARNNPMRFVDPTGMYVWGDGFRISVDQCMYGGVYPNCLPPLSTNGRYDASGGWTPGGMTPNDGRDECYGFEHGDVYKTDLWCASTVPGSPVSYSEEPANPTQNKENATKGEVIGSPEEAQATEEAIDEAKIAVKSKPTCANLFVGGASEAANIFDTTRYQCVGLTQSRPTAWTASEDRVYINRGGDFMSMTSLRYSIDNFGRALTPVQGRAAVLTHEAAHQNRRRFPNAAGVPSFLPDGLPGQTKRMLDNHRLIVTACW